MRLLPARSGHRHATADGQKQPVKSLEKVRKIQSCGYTLGLLA